MKNSNAALAIGAMVIGTLSIPVIAFVNWVFGLFLLSVPLYMIYKAS